MSDIQWHSWTAEDMEPSSTGIWARRSEVEAALAAKDAEIKGLKQRLALIAWWCGADDSKVGAAVDAHQEPKP